MPRYCAFFASMNVGGNRLAMADLRHVLEREELEDVETVVASGNVLFSFDDRPTEGLSEMLAYIVKDRFGFDTFAAVRSIDEVRAAIEGNPFSADGQDNLVHTLFASGPVSPANVERVIADYTGRGAERIAAGERSLHVDYVSGVGGSRLTGPFIERRLGCSVTGRNMQSLKRILDKMA
ncbi:DUF1697 domain-containing protein [Croceicoccus ponticola]|uniref:DUF1697 domain-containing protein n=1 Tax=Croceicoccus ponticola TaxID=2217664 RepID=A0A437GU84_9SPHN|nr:DUF1697 domain-containing protein [Croceicoccus ponticola]RVQ64881.1 DUF1697 domain-containing protein [Croceicoccus ponticola]